MTCSKWIARNPQTLNKELLVDGFNDINESLDLLTIDKDSNLVVIEDDKEISCSSNYALLQTIKLGSHYDI